MPESSNDNPLQRLGDAMSDLQERCFRASWMGVVPTIVGLCRRVLRTGRRQPWGMDGLSVADAELMWKLARQVGGWVEPDWDEGGDSYRIAWPFSPLDSAGLEGEDVPWLD